MYLSTQSLRVPLRGSHRLEMPLLRGQLCDQAVVDNSRSEQYASARIAAEIITASVLAPDLATTGCYRVGQQWVNRPGL